MKVCGHDLLEDRLFGLHKSEMDGLSALITTELKNQLARWIRLCEGSWDTYEDYMYHLGWAGSQARSDLIWGIAEVLRPWFQFMPGRPDLSFTNEMTGFGETSWGTSGRGCRRHCTKVDARLLLRLRREQANESHGL